jgi:hypothetical protein
MHQWICRYRKLLMQRQRYGFVLMEWICWQWLYDHLLQQWLLQIWKQLLRLLSRKVFIGWDNYCMLYVRVWQIQCCKIKFV